MDQSIFVFSLRSKCFFSAFLQCINIISHQNATNWLSVHFYTTEVGKTRGKGKRERMYEREKLESKSEKTKRKADEMRVREREMEERYS